MLKNINSVQDDFLIAFEDLKNDLLLFLLENKEGNKYEAWKPYWEIQSLICRIKSGEEEFRKIAS